MNIVTDILVDQLDAIVAANMRAEVARYGIAHETLAEVAGITPGAVSHKLLGRRPITIKELGLFADAIGLDPATFLVAPVTSRRGFSVAAPAEVAAHHGLAWSRHLVSYDDSAVAPLTMSSGNRKPAFGGFCTPSGARTLDPQIKSLLLYQLS